MGIVWATNQYRENKLLPVAFKYGIAGISYYNLDEPDLFDQVWGANDNEVVKNMIRDNYDKETNDNRTLHANIIYKFFHVLKIGDYLISKPVMLSNISRTKVSNDRKGYLLGKVLSDVRPIRSNEMTTNERSLHGFSVVRSVDWIFIGENRLTEKEKSSIQINSTTLYNPSNINFSRMDQVFRGLEY